MGKSIEDLVPDFATMSSAEKAQIQVAVIHGENYYVPDRVLAEGIRDLAYGMIVRGAARYIREARVTTETSLGRPMTFAHHDAYLEGILHDALNVEDMQ